MAHEVALSDRGFKPKGLIGGGVKRHSGYGKSIFLDRIGFLGVMRKFGFCEKWRNFLHGCLCNEHFGVLVDGHRYFPASRGLLECLCTVSRSMWSKCLVFNILHRCEWKGRVPVQALSDLFEDPMFDGCRVRRELQARFREGALIIYL